MTAKNLDQENAAAPKTMPLVCIVLLNWNQCVETIACLQSLKAISYRPFVTIVIDNGSTDSSKTEIQEKFPQTHFLEQARNVGCSGGRNIGLQYALNLNADYVLFLDNDTLASHDFLDILIEVAEHYTDVGIVSSKIVLESNPEICWTAGGTVDANGMVEALYYFQDAKDVPETPFFVDWVPGCVLLVSRSVCNSLKMFDDTYFIYFEDIDWCIRAKYLGAKVMVAPKSVVFHKVSHSSGGDYSQRKLYYMARNRLMFASRHAKGSAKWKTIAIYIYEDIKDAFGDVVFMKSPKHAIGRLLGTWHFLMRRKGKFDI